MPSSRLITKPFVAVTVVTAAFFVYVGMLVPILPTFIEDELGGGELGVGLSIAVFALTAVAARPWIARAQLVLDERRQDRHQHPDVHEEGGRHDGDGHERLRDQAGRGHDESSWWAQGSPRPSNPSLRRKSRPERRHTDDVTRSTSTATVSVWRAEGPMTTPRAGATSP